MWGVNAGKAMRQPINNCSDRLRFSKWSKWWFLFMWRLTGVISVQSHPQTDSLSSMVTTTGSFHFVAFMYLVCLSPVTQLLASQECFQRGNVFPVECFLTVARTILQQPVCSHSVGEKKPIDSLWNPTEQWCMETPRCSKEQLMHHKAFYTIGAKCLNLHFQTSLWSCTHNICWYWLSIVFWCDSLQLILDV